MVNRILIRIKVVQMLYSYLLTKNEFKIESAPESTSRDKNYAYTLYLDLLLLILELSGYSVKNGNEKSPLESLGATNLLSSSKMAKALASDDDIRNIIIKGNNNIADFDEIILRLYSTITTSVTYRDFRKIKSPEIKDEISMWKVVINTIFLKEPLFIETLRKNPSFTHAGYEYGIKMLINTLSNYSDTRTLLLDAQRSLDTSLNKAYELYHSMLMLMVEITKLQARRIEAAKSKYLPTDEELNPNMRFVENQFIKSIENHPGMKSYLNSNPISWENETNLVKTLLDEITASQVYNEYMSANISDYTGDCELWRNIFKNIIMPSDELCETLESKSVYWNDELAIMGTFVIKTLKQFSKGNGVGVSLLPQYKDEEDAQFGKSLFMHAIKNRDEYRNYIDMFINDSQWDPERLAFMDNVIMTTAIAELINYPMIPIAVTLNEYIEIANCYSTAKSGQFINGILYSVINHLKSEGKLNKD